MMKESGNYLHVPRGKRYFVDSVMIEVGILRSLPLESDSIIFLTLRFQHFIGCKLKHFLNLFTEKKNFPDLDTNLAKSRPEITARVFSQVRLSSVHYWQEPSCLRPYKKLIVK